MSDCLHQLEGFSTAFGEAGGEDLDLGIRLRELGRLVYAPRAIVSHEFAEDRHDFQRRFERYGRANRLLEHVHKLPSLRPEPKFGPLFKPRVWYNTDLLERSLRNVLTSL